MSTDNGGEPIVIVDIVTYDKERRKKTHGGKSIFFNTILVTNVHISSYFTLIKISFLPLMESSFLLAS